MKIRNWRTVRTACGLLLALALMALWMGQSRAQRTDDPPARLLPNQPDADVSSFVPGVVLVQLTGGTARAADAARRLGVADEALSPLSISGQSDLYRLAVPSGEEESSAALLASRPDVLFAEPDYLYYVTETIPNDPLYSRYQWNLSHINANLGWDRTIGSPQVVIGVVDTGVDLGHPEFVGKIVGGIDTVNDDFDAQDDRGHGTHVASIAAALGNNRAGLAGVNWNAQIMPVKVLNAAGSGSSSQVAAGITWAADNGADILNMSLASSNSSSVVANAIQYAYEQGVLLIAAAGNAYMDGNQTSYPAAYDHVIGVAAVNDTDGHASYSNSGSYVDVAAPGGDPSGSSDADSRHWIPGAYWRGSDISYAWLSGTSQAAPHVAGLAGLLLGLDPTLTPDQLTQMITSSAVDVQSPGWDEFSGFGRIDIVAALAELAPTARPELIVDTQLLQSATDAPGVVAVGEEIGFTIRITNTGTTALSLVPLEESYDSTYMTFVRSNPAPDTVSTDTLQWSNLTASGMLSPGSALTVTATFLTRATTDDLPTRQTTNLAQVSNVRDEMGQLPPAQKATAQVRVARSAVLVENEIAAPELTAVGAGVDITFNIRVENVGEVSLAHVPVYNLYEADVLRFLSTNISSPRTALADGEGELFWEDITDDLGELAPGEAVQFTATFKMIASRSTINLAQVGQVIDANGDVVPPVQGVGSVEVVPVAPPIYEVYMPKISGYVAAEIEEMPCPVPGCPVGGLRHPNGMAVHTELNRLYISSRDTNQLIVLDARTLAPITTVDTGAEPWDVVINQNTNRVYVSNYASKDVWVYDATTLAIDTKIHVGPNPMMMEIFPDINTVAVIVRGLNGIAIIENSGVVQYMPTGGTGAFGFASDQVNKQLIVGNRDTGSAWVIYKDGGEWRLNGGSEMKNFGGMERTGPFEIAYNPNNNRIYVISMRPNGTWFVDVIEKQSMTSLVTLATVDVGSSGSDRDPNVGGAGIAVDPVTNNVFVTDTADGTVTVIGPNNGVVATVPTGEEPFDVAVNPVTNQIFISLRRDNRVHKFADIY